MPSPFVDLLAGLGRAFDSVGAGWYLFGAQAALLYGVARFTADVDVTVHLRGEDPKALVKALSDAGFQMRASDEDFIERTRVLPALHTRRHGRCRSESERLACGESRFSASRIWVA